MDDATNLDGSATGQMSQTYPPQKQEKQVEKHEEESKEPEEQKKKGFQFPSTFAILFALTIVVAILTWIIPAGVYNLDANGDPVPGTYHQVPSNYSYLVLLR